MAHRYTIEQIKALQADLDKAAREIATRHGIAFVKSKGTYGEVLAVKVEFGAIKEDGTVDTTEARDWERYAAYFKLKPEWLGRSVVQSGHEYTIIGVRTRSKTPVIVKRTDNGKTYKMSADFIALYLNREDARKEEAAKAKA